MLFRRKKKHIEENNAKKEVEVREAYDKTFKLQKLKVMVIIVDKPQGDFFIKKFQENNVAASFLVSGNGTATRDIYDKLGLIESKKDIVFSLVSEADLPALKNIVETRFSTSKRTKGVSFCLEIDSVAGVLIYKFLSNTRVNERRENYGDKRTKTL